MCSRVDRCQRILCPLAEFFRVDTQFLNLILHNPFCGYLGVALPCSGFPYVSFRTSMISDRS